MNAVCAEQRFYTEKEYIMNTVRELLKKEIVAVAQKAMPGTKVTFDMREKNNGTKLEYFKANKIEEKINEVHAIPCVCIENFIEIISDGQITVDEAAKELVSYYVKELENGPSIGEINAEYIKKNIRFKLVNKEMNDLSGTPYKDFLDLAKVLVVEIGEHKHSIGFVTMTEQYVEFFKLDTDELFKLAEEHTKMEVECFDLNYMHMAMLGVPVPTYDSDSSSVIVRTKNYTFGAVAMTMIDEIEKVANVLDSDLFVIPSSVQEIILVKRTIGTFEEDVRDFNQMVHDVNRSSVEKEEWLADHAYFFDRKTRELRIV